MQLHGFCTRSALARQGLACVRTMIHVVKVKPTRNGLRRGTWPGCSESRNNGPAAAVIMMRRPQPYIAIPCTKYDSLNFPLITCDHAHSPG